MPYSFQKFILGNRILFLWLGTILVTSISFLTIYYKIRPQDNPQAPLALHYNVVVGVDLYGAGVNLFLIPFASTIIAIVNFVVYRMIRRRQSFLAELATGISFVVSIVLYSAVLFLLRVN